MTEIIWFLFDFYLRVADLQISKFVNIVLGCHWFLSNAY